MVPECVELHIKKWDFMVTEEWDIIYVSHPKTQDINGVSRPYTSQTKGYDTPKGDRNNRSGNPITRKGRQKQKGRTDLHHENHPRPQTDKPPCTSKTQTTF